MGGSAGKFDEEFLAQQRKRLLEMEAVLLQTDGGKMTLAKTTLNYSNHRLGDIQRALQKIEDGTYGLSDESGELIPQSRLEAFPDALYTEREQEELEDGK